MKKRKIWIILGIVVVLVAVVAISYAKTTNGTADKDEKKPDTPIAKVDFADVQVEVLEVGNVEPEIKVDIKSVLSGTVVDLPIREGDLVKKGQVVAVIEPDVNQAQTIAAIRRTVNQAEIEYLDSQTDFKAKDALLKSGLISEEAHRVAETRFRSNRETLDAAREKTKIVELSGVPMTTNPNQRMNITAPMDGVIIKRQIELGEAVSGAGSFNAGTVIATVADLATMLVKAGINEVDIGKVTLGSQVTVTLDAFPKVRFNAKVKRISPAARIADQVKVFDVEIALDNLGKELRTGMTANVSIKGEKVAHVAAVPVEAIFHRDDGEMVYLRKVADKTAKEATAKNGKDAAKPKETPNPRDAWKQFFIEQKIETGIASLSHVQVMAGLKIGDEVALEDPTKPKKQEGDM